MNRKKRPTITLGPDIALVLNGVRFLTTPCSRGVPLDPKTDKKSGAWIRSSTGNEPLDCVAQVVVQQRPSGARSITTRTFFVKVTQYCQIPDGSVRYKSPEDVLRRSLEAQHAEKAGSTKNAWRSAHIEESYQQTERGELI
jgi:hypothetical protein